MTTTTDAPKVTVPVVALPITGAGVPALALAFKIRSIVQDRSGLTGAFDAELVMLDGKNERPVGRLVNRGNGSGSYLIETAASARVLWDRIVKQIDESPGWPVPSAEEYLADALASEFKMLIDLSRRRTTIVRAVGDPEGYRRVTRSAPYIDSIGIEPKVDAMLRGRMGDYEVLDALTMRFVTPHVIGTAR